MIGAVWQDTRKGMVVRAPGADITTEAVTYRVSVQAHGQWSTVLTVVPSIEGASSRKAFVHTGRDGLSPSDRRRQEWVAKIPVLHMGNRSIERTLEELQFLHPPVAYAASST
jgi:hypothetical protein